MKTFTITEIAEKVKGTLAGNSDLVISGPEDLAKANETQITFVGSKKFVKAWEASKACAAIVNEDIAIEPTDGKAIIKVKDADLAMADILGMYMPESVDFEMPIHPTAVIHPSVVMGENCRIGAGCYIGKDVSIGANSTIYPNVSIFDHSTIGILPLYGRVLLSAKERLLAAIAFFIPM